MSFDVPDLERHPRRGFAAELLRLVAASLLGGLIVLSGSEAGSALRASLELESADPAFACLDGPDLTDEWRWKRRRVQHEVMFRDGENENGHARRKGVDWIRGGGR